MTKHTKKQLVREIAMNKGLKIYASVSFILLNICIACVFIFPILQVELEQRGVSEVNTILSYFDFVGYLLIVSFLSVWGIVVHLWYKTKENRESHNNQRMLTLIVVGNIFSAYYYYFKRKKIFGVD